MRQLKRMELASKSLVFSHFSESLNGISTIRAYNAKNRFSKMMYKYVDENLIYYFANNISNQWLAIRLEFVFFSKTFLFSPKNYITNFNFRLAI